MSRRSQAVRAGFAPDLYPRQRAGFVVVLIGIPLLFAAIVSGWGRADPAVLLLALWIGIGLGMMAGNTRSLRTRSGSGWRRAR